MKNLNFFTELKNRWTEHSPLFFKKLMKFGAWLTALSLSLVGLGAIHGVAIPDIVPQIAGYLATAGAVTTFISKLPVKDPDYETLDK
jgi:hypothetical protein